MTAAESAGRDRSVARVARPPFDGVTILFHWITVLLVIGLFLVAWRFSQAQDAEAARSLLTFHRSLGATVWSLTVLRLGWRLTGARFPPFPATMPPVQQLAARLSEYALYALLLAQPLTGFAQSIFRGRPFDLLIWVVPRLVERDRALVRVFHAVHEGGAWVLAGLIGLHASAALLHALVLRDGVFESMWPLRRRR